MTSQDPILDEIRRVRKELIRKHGGWEGFDRHIRKLEADHRRLERRRKSAAKARRNKLQKLKAQSSACSKRKNVA